MTRAGLLRWLPVAAFCLLLGACALPGQPPLETGRMEQGRLVNSQYRFFWLAPQGWEAIEPQTGESFNFGWAQGDSRALLWVMPGGGEPEAAGRALSLDQGWKLNKPALISWQGFPAWDAHIFPSGRAGRLRVVRAPKALIAVAVFSPQEVQGPGREAARLAGIINGLHLIPPGDLLHLVRHPNESLSIIAMWYTGSVGDWPKIKEYNHLPSDALVLGQGILIPADMLVRSSPLPAWAVPPLPAKTDSPANGPSKGGQEPGSEIKLMPIGPK
jgi:hypothetical protein